jgi:hypothetical protein
MSTLLCSLLCSTESVDFFTFHVIFFVLTIKKKYQVTVQTLGTGFLINVISIKNMPGLLVSVLEVFEELGLHVLEAKASCAEAFHLEAVGGEVRLENKTIKLNISAR